jgi:glycosyltransferase involved in cell wall biosynthesis
MDNRPRVILEAQAHGIPIIAHDWPGLREAVGDGGLLLERDADVAAWTSALRSVWGDRSEQERLSEAARRHAARPEVDPDAIVSKFLDLLHSLVVTSQVRADTCA